MFTGIIRTLGIITQITKGDRDTRFVIQSDALMRGHHFERGASIASNGVCLTLVEKGLDWYAVEVSGETISKTTLGSWLPGTVVNLEPSLKIGDELGGHLVSGHVDGVTEIVSVVREGGSHRVRLAMPPSHAGFIAGKGSIALDGISLTVNDVTDDSFGVNIIPFTWDHTNFHTLKTGSTMNFEVDVMARYAARLLQTRSI